MSEKVVRMQTQRDGQASVTLGAAEKIGLRLVAQGRFEDLSDACRAGLRRLEEDERVIDHLVSLGEQGMASGADDSFDIDAFIEEPQAHA